MNIRKIEKNDISLIRPMWEELNKHHGTLSTNFKEHFYSFTFEVRQQQIKKKEDIAVFVAEVENARIGYCIVSVDDKLGEIDSIFIEPEYRKKGIGERLISEAETWLKSKNIEKINISVAEGNESVFDFYYKQGYLKRFTVFEKKA